MLSPTLSPSKAGTGNANIQAAAGQQIPIIEVGAKLTAKDRADKWLEASVVNWRGTGNTAELLVHFRGWNKVVDFAEQQKG